jgi:hypothetical protein
VLVRLTVTRFDGLQMVFASGAALRRRAFPVRVLPKPFTLEQLSAALAA